MCYLTQTTPKFQEYSDMTAMNRHNSRNCFMLLYYQIVTCLLATCAAAANMGLHVDVTACFPVKNSFSDVIMNEHHKLKTINEDTVWGEVSSREGTRPGTPNRQNLPILDSKILCLKHPDI